MRYWDIISTTDRHMSNSFAKEVFLAGFSFANIDTIVVFTSFRISTFFIALAFTLKKKCLVRSNVYHVGRIDTT